MVIMNWMYHMNDVCEDCHLEAEYEDRMTYMFEYHGGYWPTTDEEYQDMVDYAEESGFWEDYEEEGI